MKIVEPRVFLVADTHHVGRGMNQMLEALGVPQWSTDAKTSGEELIEVGGRLCYKAFGTDLNKNLTKVREGNKDYIGNILKQGHGSVLEHASVTFVFLNVSRILTHELVRHRPGAAYSQESMRFVRLDDIPMYIPDLIDDFAKLVKTPEEAKQLQDCFISDMKNAAVQAEWSAKQFTHLLDMPDVPFSLKKKITSALRRMAPGGHTTNIMVTANHRAWRHMIEMRTSGGAEEEIRKVFYEVGNQLCDRYPAIYQDMISFKDEQRHAFTYSKV